MLKVPNLKSFHDYFQKQWIKSKFNKWAVFHTPSGFTTTNNPIESYNKSIKCYFTNNLKLNLLPAFEMFKTLIYDESSKIMDYKTTVSVNKNLENKAKQLELFKFVKHSDGMYAYNHKSGNQSLVNLRNKTCTCAQHADKGVCLHLIYIAGLEKAILPGMAIKDKFSVRNRKKVLKMKKSEINFEQDDEDFDNFDTTAEDIIYEENVIQSDPDPEIAVATNDDIVYSNVIEYKAKRGRPKKVSKALINDLIEKPEKKEKKK